MACRGLPVSPQELLSSKATPPAPGSPSQCAWVRCQVLLRPSGIVRDSPAVWLPPLCPPLLTSLPAGEGHSESMQIFVPSSASLPLPPGLERIALALATYEAHKKTHVESPTETGSPKSVSTELTSRPQSAGLVPPGSSKGEFVSSPVLASGGRWHPRPAFASMIICPTSSLDLLAPSSYEGPWDYIRLVMVQENLPISRPLT